MVGWGEPRRRLSAQRRHRLPVAAVVAVVVGSIAAGCGSGAPSGTPAASTSSAPSSDAFPNVVARVRSGVVRIETRLCGDQAAIGTGLIIGPRLVATVEHVVDSAAGITIKRAGKTLASGSVIGTDPARDLALLRTSVPVRGYRFRLAARPPRLGESVAAMGYPFGLPLSVTRGTVSGLDRTIPIEGTARRRLVQTDAEVNPGNSGGPLLATETGEVVGLIDIGSLEANGIAFAVSAQVARPLLAAWKEAPQPIALSHCPGEPPETLAAPPPPKHQPSPAPRPTPSPSVGVPVRYQGLFTSVDRLERCNATASYVYCSAGPSGRAVKLVVGDAAHDLGVHGSADRGGPSLPEGTSFTTPNGDLRCASSSRGIDCTDLTTGNGFVLGDYRLLLTNRPSAGGVGVPSTYAGRFTSVDRLERCYATNSYVVCSAGPSGKAAELVAGGPASYQGVLGSTDKGGPSMPEGTRFTTPSGSISCGSSSRGITCTDAASGDSFTIGDYHVRLVNNGSEQVY
ncbi:MAG TPA: S1C family serine protease [Gaiellaceae bacterium]|nr:S1C family serine protease [Gaiellaceae bacterium]